MGNVFVVSLFFLVVIGIESILLLLCHRKNRMLITRLMNTQKSHENRLKHEMSKLEHALRERAQKLEELERDLECKHTEEEKQFLKDMVVSRLKDEVEMLKQRREGDKANDTLLIKHTLRSGDRISTPQNLVLIGDVNPGAEIVAGGDVVVLGALRGSVQAGMPATHTAVVIALQLQPVQLRIGKYLSEVPLLQYKRQAFPQIAKVAGDRVTIEALSPKHKGTETSIVNAEV